MKRKLVRGILGALGLVIALLGGLAAYVQLTYQRDFGGTPLPKIEASRDPAVIARGRYVAHAVAHCSACHGPADKVSRHELAEDLDDMRGGFVMRAGPFGTFYPSNLTPDPETGLGKLSDAQLARVIRHGVAPDGRLDVFMSFAVGPMADDDLVALVSYLRSIAPVKSATLRDEWGFVAKAMSPLFKPRMAEAPAFVREGGAKMERGEYLANGPAACVGCHSPYDVTKGFALTGPKFSGEAEAEPDSTDPSFEIVGPNLTPDPETGALRNLDEAGFLERFKKAGRLVAGSKMPWENFARLTDDDLRSVYRYLRSLPPVRRDVGPTRRARGSFKG